MCPVCGFENEFEPDERGVPSQEICPSCGTQFGYDDCASDLVEREARQAALRASWIAMGMKWYSRADRRPQVWDPEAQLRRLTGR